MPNEIKVRPIAMWSGPRNISTAMMRSWENRPDTVVVDEPFYAYFLDRTRKPHPGAAEVIAHGQTDWRAVVADLTDPAGGDGAVFCYQKHMTHHLLPEIDRAWLSRVANCFLIRHPREVIASYLKRNGEPTPEDLGFPQQVEIFEWVRKHTGSTPPVIDARDVLQNPERTLTRLCEAIEVPFDRAMLSWPAGERGSDGVWAKHWYAEVVQSTSFQPYREKHDAVPDGLRDVYEECRTCYEKLHQFRLH
jgi:hypothetical protein